MSCPEQTHRLKWSDVGKDVGRHCKAKIWNAKKKCVCNQQIFSVINWVQWNESWARYKSFCLWQTTGLRNTTLDKEVLEAFASSFSGHPPKWRQRPTFNIYANATMPFMFIILLVPSWSISFSPMSFLFGHPFCHRHQHQHHHRAQCTYLSNATMLSSASYSCSRHEPALNRTR